MQFLQEILPLIRQQAKVRYSLLIINWQTVLNALQVPLHIASEVLAVLLQVVAQLLVDNLWHFTRGMSTLL